MDGLIEPVALGQDYGVPNGRCLRVRGEVDGQALEIDIERKKRRGLRVVYTNHQRERPEWL